MLSVYLDQFVWIHLARAANGKASSEAWVDALDVARHAKSKGHASFPLDMYRYWETQNNSVAGSRNRLVDFMVELSDFDTIKTSAPLLNFEIDSALHARFGRPDPGPRPVVLGRGIEHMTDGRVTLKAFAELANLTSRSSADLRTAVDVELEEFLLRLSPDDHARAALPLSLIDWGQLYTDHEVQVAQRITAQKLPRDLLTAAVVRADLDDVGVPIKERMVEAGITETDVTERLDGAGILRLVQSIPTRRVTNALRVSKHIHAQQQQNWKGSDFVDVVSLPVPVVYCDVVFTEHEWVRAMTRDKTDRLAERFNTKLIRSPAELVAVLIGAAA